MTARVRTTSHGARWLDLCLSHGLAVLEPSPRMPTTMEGIRIDLHEALTQAAAETGRTSGQGYGIPRLHDQIHTLR
ncbi:hypothetical protein [Streptomyces sp. NBC_00019]|uniref:hypothetical protein n=1 Tax=Streptomyces sp. NBC_00019 TaxID=2975623 RepID=UPI002F908D9F